MVILLRVQDTIGPGARYTCGVVNSCRCLYSTVIVPPPHTCYIITYNVFRALMINHETSNRSPSCLEHPQLYVEYHELHKPK